MTNNKSMRIQLNDDWFRKDKTKFLNSEEFKHFEEVSGANLEDLASEDILMKKIAQEDLIKKSIILNEIRNSHFGYGFPFLVYTQEMEFFEKVPKHNLEIDKLILSYDMGDSLRRRHIALTHAILPQVIGDLYERFGKPILIKNLGSGAGLDVLNAAKNTNGRIGKVLNYDISTKAIELGRKMTKYAEDRGLLTPNVVEYVEESLTNSKEKANLAVMIGIICGLDDRYAKILMTQARKNIENEGILVISSSNQHMESTNAIGSFLIQNIGSSNDETNGWSLNFRSRERMEDLLKSCGFREISIYDDANYPGEANLPDEIKHSVDCFPSIATGLKEKSYKPLSLPSRETLNKKTGYNWIAIAKK